MTNRVAEPESETDGWLCETVGSRSTTTRSSRAMANPTISATVRDLRGKGPARQLRMKGQVPAIVYGLDAENQAVSVNEHELNKILRSATGVNSIIALQVEGSADQLVLTRQIDRHPVKTTLTHVDFIRVSVDADVAAEVHLVINGDPEGVRLGGKLEQLLFSVGVACRPDRMPNHIDCDIADLGLGAQLHIRDLVVPPGVTFTNAPDDLIVQVSVPRGLLLGGEGEAED